MRTIVLVLSLVSAMLLGAAEPPFFVEVGKIPNMRDLGGWKGLDGRRVKTGQIYRSAGLNDNAGHTKTVDEKGVTNKVMHAGKTRVNDANRALLVDKLGIRTDIDLRSDGECWGMTGSPLGEKVAWEHHSIGAYSLATVKAGRETKKTTHYRIFKLIMEPAKRPLVFHCIAGRDRTGTIAALTLALLGVSEEDIIREYLSTPSCKTRTVWVPRIKKLLDERLKARFPADTLAESAARYFEHLGFTRAEIESFRTQMLEK